MDIIEAVAREICLAGFDGHDPDELVTKGDPPPGDPVGYYLEDGDWQSEWPRWMSYIPQAEAAVIALRKFSSQQ